MVEKLLLGSPDGRKGIGYTIEAFVAILTLFVFAVGSIQTTASPDWNGFQAEVSAKDIGYVLHKTGKMERLLERGETGSIQTAASALTSDRLQFSGTVKGLPIGEKRIGFHVLDNKIHDFNPKTASSLGDSCYSDKSDNDLEEIDSEEPVKRTQNKKHGVYLYIADTDPDIPGGFNSETDYDSIWVDNSTRCQFSAAEGPFYKDEFLFWGDSSDGTPDMNYDLKNISNNGNKLTVYEAEQPVNFRNTMRENVNGISAETRFDTFNFSTNDLSVYDALIFRRKESLDLIESRQERVMDYLEDHSVLFLMNLEQNDLDNGFMSKTGMEWRELDWTEKPSGANFSEAHASRKTENLFLGQKGDRQSVSLLPGGNISSGSKLVYPWHGKYNTDQWNATNMSMETVSPMELLEGVPESGCENYRKGNFSFPDDDYFAYSSELGDCSEGIWGLSIDLDQNGVIDSNEKTYVNGDRMEVGGRSYRVKIHSGSEAEFVYAESDKIELVNYKTEFPLQNINQFARAGYRDSYSDEDRKLLVSVLYQLSGTQNNFGPSTSSEISTTVVGSVKNKVYMPYRLDMRWRR